MPYASQAEIALSVGGDARLVELADFDNDGVADAAVIARAQAAADGFIDPFLRVRYATPIASPSPSLVRLAADHAVYEMKKWRGGLTEMDLKDLENRERELKDYSKGLRRPDEPLPAKSSATRSAWVDRNDSEMEDALLSRKDFEG